MSDFKLDPSKNNATLAGGIQVPTNGIKGDNSEIAQGTVDGNGDVIIPYNCVRVLNKTGSDITLRVKPVNAEDYFDISVVNGGSNSDWNFRKIKIANSTGYDVANMYYQYQVNGG